MSFIDSVIARTVHLVPKHIVRKFSQRYVAGETLEDAVRVVTALNRSGAIATLDVLGEHISLPEESLQAVEQYLELIQTIEKERLDANISIKLTALGLKLDRELCLKNTRTLVEAAREVDNFVRIDIEDSSCTDDTLGIYVRLREDYTNVGVALQAYMRRSSEDVSKLLEGETNVRLCKGIYIEPRSIAYKEPDLINRNYTALLSQLLEGGAYVGIATHDERLVWEAYQLIQRMGLDKNAYEFQMLLGVDEELRTMILNQGHRLRVYVPFGVHWYSYCVRRLQENPRIARYVLKNLL